MSMFRKSIAVAALGVVMPFVAAAAARAAPLVPMSETADQDSDAQSAQQNQDLQRIPDAVQVTPPTTGVPPGPTEVANGRLYIEDAATVWSRRMPIVALPGQVAVPDWQNRTSLDGRYDWTLTPGLDFTLSDRINLIEQSDIDFWSNHNYRNDFREGYVTWQPLSQTTIEAGRVNVKEGVALGFNPTDFFKTRTLVDQVSQDPSVLREDRLGTAMVRVQQVFEGSAISVAFAPKLVSPTPVSLGFEPSLNPGFGRTNDHDRILVTASHDFGDDWAPQLLAYHEDTATKVGANLTHAITGSIIAYAEWAGGNQSSLIDTALQYGRATGAIPVNTPMPISDSGKSFMNDVAVGASWSPTAKTMFNLEYLYHQAGFTKEDWNHWFNTGTSFPSAAPALWYIRLYGLDQQEPISQHQIFVRASWSDAFFEHLQLSAFAFVDLFDGSTNGQLSASYNLTDVWTVGGLVGASLGAPRSDYGSVPEAVSGIVQIVRYF
jgi:hypothetical protein